MVLVRFGRSASWRPSFALGALLTLVVATPIAQASCVGDCSGDGEVTVDEIIKGVNIALDVLPLSQCAVFDGDGSGGVTVDELIRAVGNALNSCPVEPTATPTPTTQPTLSFTATPTSPSTPTNTSTPTASPTATSTASGTPTPTAIATPSASPTVESTPTQGATATTRTAGLVPTSANVLRVIPDILAALLGHLPGGGGSGGASLEFPFDCSAGGGGVLSCDQQILPPPGPPVYTISFDQCMILSSGGAIVTVHGAVTATGQQGEICGTIPSMAALGIDSLTLQIDSDRGTTLASFSGVSAQATLSCNGGNCSCTYDTMELDLSGMVAVTSSDATGTTLSSTTATFGPGTHLLTSVQSYDFECVPLVYHLQFDGTADFNTDGSAYTLGFDSYLLQVDATSGEDAIDVSGTLTSTCLNGSVGLRTQTLLIMDRGAICPSDGLLTVDHGSLTDSIHYLDPGVEIDLGDDNSVDQAFGSCLDPGLAVCAN